MVLNKGRAARAAKGASERFHELSELCQDRQERDQMGSRKVVLSSGFCRGTKKNPKPSKNPTQKINWSVNPLNFQGIIFILNLGTVNLEFVRSS